jgi:hypothetical protein
VAAATAYTSTPAATSLRIDSAMRQQCGKGHAQNGNGSHVSLLSAQLIRLATSPAGSPAAA